MSNEQHARSRWDIAMQTAQQAVDHLILATPTGVIREALTEANIKLMVAETQERERRRIVDGGI